MGSLVGLEGVHKPAMASVRWLRRSTPASPSGDPASGWPSQCPSHQRVAGAVSTTTAPTASGAAASAARHRGWAASCRSRAT
eukprot:2497659-Pyramimonas_sp.AAC.1